MNIVRVEGEWDHVGSFSPQERQGQEERVDGEVKERLWCAGVGEREHEVFVLCASDLQLTTGLHIPVDSGVAAAFMR